MPHVKLYFIGVGYNMARCVGGEESRDLRGVTDAHVFDLPDGIAVEDCVGRNPTQIISQLGGKIVDPAIEPWEDGTGM